MIPDDKSCYYYFSLRLYQNGHHCLIIKPKIGAELVKRPPPLVNEDFLEHLFVGTNHQYMLFFTQKGKCFWMRVYEIPEGSRISKGSAIQNLVNIEQDDRVKAFICTQDLKDEDYINNHFVIMATKKGQVKKTSLEKYSRPRANGINAITIKRMMNYLEAKLTNGNSQILLAVKSGKAIRFEESKTRPMGRGASGVRGINLANPQ